MARRSVPPSNLSLLGLVRHLTDVERHWFRRVLDGQDIGWLYRRDHDRDAAFNEAVADPELVQAAWAAWREEVRFAERFVDAAPDLEVTGTYEDDVISLREVLVHMIESTPGMPATPTCCANASTDGWASSTTPAAGLNRRPRVRPCLDRFGGREVDTTDRATALKGVPGSWQLHALTHT